MYGPRTDWDVVLGQHYVTLSIFDWVHVPKMIVKIFLGMGPASKRQCYKVSRLALDESTPRIIFEFVKNIGGWVNIWRVKKSSAFL